MSEDANLDVFDRRILTVLQAEGRISNTDLAERIGLSPSPCLRRVRLLEKAGVIKGYRACLDRGAAGVGMTVFVEIKVTRHSRNNAASVQERLTALPGCVACHMVSGEADFLIEMAVPDLDAYERVLTEHLLTMDEVETVRSNFSLRSILTDGALAIRG